MPAWSSMWDSITSGNLREAANYAFIDQKTVDTLESNKAGLEQRIIQGQLAGTIPKAAGDKLLEDIAPTAFPQAAGFGTENDPISLFSKGVKNTVGGALNFVALSIPWQVYAIVLVGAALWLAPTIMPMAAKFLGGRK